MAQFHKSIINEQSPIPPTMKIYNVLDSTTGAVVYTYQSVLDHPIDFREYPLAAYTHSDVTPPVAGMPDVPADPCEWLIDLGPYYDRFGSSWMDILTSTSPVVGAIVKNGNIRKYIDLKNPAVLTQLKVLQSYIPSITDDLIATMLNTPVRPEENRALRIDYFNSMGVL